MCFIHCIIDTVSTDLVQSLWWSHAALDVQRSNVLPVLLQQRDEEVDRQVNILCQLISIHVDMSHGNRQAQDFLHLELDSGFHLINLLCH